MVATNPGSTTLGDLVQAMLRECGALGVGQSALADDTNDCWMRVQWMLQQWERKRWLVFHTVDLAKTSTGAVSYTVGPGGDFNTGTVVNGLPTSTRPDRLRSAFVRQIQTTPPNQVDYPLEIIQSREDYNRIALKALVAFPGAAFLDTAWPLANLYVWPVPNANIYEIHITILEQLSPAFANLQTVLNFPYEYYAALLYNGALRLRPKYRIGTHAGDELPGLARDSLGVLRGANTQIARLTMPRGLVRGKEYNIFSDRFY